MNNGNAQHDIMALQERRFTEEGVRTAAEALEIVRRAYAKQVMAAAGVDDPRIEAGFAVVRREDFLGPGRWPIVPWFRRRPSPMYLPISAIPDYPPK